jgi:hypothetical protein
MILSLVTRRCISCTIHNSNKIILMSNLSIDLRLYKLRNSYFNFYELKID